ACTAPAPKISTGTKSGSISKASRTSAPRKPKVSAAPIAPSQVNIGVPKAKPAISTIMARGSRPNQKASTGAIISKGKALTNQKAKTLAQTQTTAGSGDNINCSRVASA